MKDYARYWYFILSMVILIFGVWEVLRVQPNPAALSTLLLWSLLLISVIALETIGYIVIWRRDSPAGKRIIAFFSSVLRLED
ncbi:MAG: hypothetical protein LN412_03355 [Candidatus Thermoplasmatota archaeon]|nr:hypothetical protein [Candidatus Thermoplasmatota archaeon]